MPVHKTLANRCRHAFDRRVIERGILYAGEGRIALEDGSSSMPFEVHARVTGSEWRPYRVSLRQGARPSTNELRASCTCPYFDGGGFCKHLWALIVYLDRNRDTAPQLVGTRALDVVSDLEADDDFTDEEREDAVIQMTLARVARARAVATQPRPKKAGTKPAPQTKKQTKKRPRTWSGRLQGIEQSVKAVEGQRVGRVGSGQRTLYYVLDEAATRRSGELQLLFYQRRLLASGKLGKLVPTDLEQGELTVLPDPVDRNMAPLVATHRSSSKGYYGWGATTRYSGGTVRPQLQELVLSELCGSGRLGMLETTADERTFVPLAWDPGAPWTLRLETKLERQHGRVRIDGRLARGAEAVALEEPRLLLRAGLVLFSDHIARLETQDLFAWMIDLRENGALEVPRGQVDDFVRRTLRLGQRLPLDLSKLGWSAAVGVPKPRVSFEAPRRGSSKNDPLRASVYFDYDPGSVRAGADFDGALIDAKARAVVQRDILREEELTSALTRLDESATLVSVGSDPREQGGLELRVKPQAFPKVVADLLDQGWSVEVERKAVRRSDGSAVKVRSGIDWFDVEGHIEFGDASASLPQVLEALRRGQHFVQLGDGSRGLLPKAWLERFASVLELGAVREDRIRFRPHQASLVDALFVSRTTADVDAAFVRLRRRIEKGARVRPRSGPRGLKGSLRDYQREGLGWLCFLQDLGIGGCLADDMGLGKTIQVLALLERQRTKGGTTLIVVPRSLVHNWIAEAQRFTPNLRAAAYWGPDRQQVLASLDEIDLLVTTYGTLRRDVAELSAIEFAYVVLDEAQAIKNPSSQTAKAAYVLRAEHRLALTGTPVENRLEDLWSIFEFLNPGMLGRSPRLGELVGQGNEPDPEAVEQLRRALRPFILRRTKTQVLTELPDKSEQVLYCELPTRQRSLYDELRNHFRASLAKRIEQVGLKRAKIHVLEALLRLRQVACHPGLVDRERHGEPAAKIDLLLEQLEELVSTGHKALVFSQFTSLLAIVRARLETRGIAYQVLDGKTRNRKEVVERFQADTDLRVFLLSLKAAGHGLNLTAADYVFILDPWWNPAVEAQAVDRAHRIGQANPVFAYRLIAKDTVEERIVELQGRKRELAEAVISTDDGFLRQLGAEELHMLLA